MYVAYLGNDKEEELFEKVISTTRGEDITVYHREPKPDEFHNYNNEAVRRKGNKVEVRHSKAQVKYGARILKGIKEGDFGIQMSKEEGPVIVSSDPKSKFYRKDWKHLFVQHAHAAVMALGAAIFGGTEAIDGSSAAQDNDDDYEDLIDGIIAEDLSQD